MCCRVNNVATFQRPYVNNVATYRLTMWPHCIKKKTLENVAVRRRTFFARKRVSKPQNMRFSLHVVSLAVSFGRLFGHSFRGARWQKRVGSQSITKTGVSVFPFSAIRIHTTKLVLGGGQILQTRMMTTYFWPRSHYQNRIFRVSRRKRYKNWYFKRWSAERTSLPWKHYKDRWFVGFLLSFSTFVVPNVVFLVSVHPKL